MTFQIKTPALVNAVDAFEHVIKHAKAGSIEPPAGRNIVSAASGVVRAVGQELRVRLMAPKLTEIEQSTNQK